MFKKMFKLVLIAKNHDLAYVIKKINVIKRKKINTLIVGLSYSLFGVRENLLGGTANLSLPSQDIFYSYLLAKKIAEENELKTVIIGLSYYSLYFDLSKSENEKSRIDNVYYPLLKNLHNYKEHKTRRKRIIKFFKTIIYNKFYKKIIPFLVSDKYFNSRNTRERICGIYEFNKLSNCEKSQIGQERASIHNKLLSYENTKMENEEILNMFMNMLIKNHIQPIIIIFPFTKYYKEILSHKFKEAFYQCVDKLDEQGKIRIVDLYNSNDFIDEDFTDTDHLNETGMIKVTQILDEILVEIKLL